MKLIVEDLAVARGEMLVLDGVSFTLSPGEALIVTGENGAGKSTLLAALAGLLPAERGRIVAEGLPAAFDGHDVARLCHLLGGGNAMKDAMSVAENLAFWRGLDGEPHLEVDEALDMVGLGHLEDVPFAHLSTGQRRRIGVARLLVSFRPIWLLDEPTSGLDAGSAAQFAELMRAHLAEDGLIVAATHVPLGLNGARTLELAAR